MSKRDRLYLLVLAGLMVLAILLESLAPQPLNWQQSYERDDASPYGGQILFEQLPALFPAVAIEPIRIPPYLHVRHQEETDKSYVFLAETFAPDRVETEELITFAERGNTIFVAAHAYDGAFADTLHLGIDLTPELPRYLGSSISASDSTRINFVNASLKRDRDYLYRTGSVNRYFQQFDTVRTTVLGQNHRGDANFIRVKLGDGAVYLSTVPLAFSNYYMLYQDNAEYAFKALSYLPVQPVYWDAYYKPLRRHARTPLRYIVSQPSLRWGYTILMATGLLFLLFHSKRRQRAIPILAPVRNTTLEFISTVGRLYYRHGDHANLAQKKITYFLDAIRTRLRLPTHRFDKAFLSQVAERSGVPLEDVHSLFALIESSQKARTISENDLHRLNAAIESFYRASAR